MSQLSVDSVDKQSGSTLTLGGAGTTVQPHASATVSGFGSPAYASNASATDDTVNVDANDNLQFNSGYGSTATAYGCRAWVNFDGTGTVAIRDSGNVSSITDVGTGNYTVSFSTNMPDSNYAAVTNGHRASDQAISIRQNENTTSSMRVIVYNYAGTANQDTNSVFVAVFR